MSEAKAEALHKAKMFQQSMTRLQERLAVIEAKPSSSNMAMTWDEEDVLEMESVSPSSPRSFESSRVRPRQMSASSSATVARWPT